MLILTLHSDAHLVETYTDSSLSVYNCAASVRNVETVGLLGKF